MDCPVCNNAMVTLELDEVEVDCCFDCGGIWLDAGELELLLGDSKAANELLGQFSKVHSAETARNCPICDKQMKKVQAGGTRENPLIIDECVKGDGLWFDKGELQTITASGNFDQARKVQNLLTEIFKNIE